MSQEAPLIGLRSVGSVGPFSKADWRVLACLAVKSHTNGLTAAKSFLISNQD